jgi:hypothetical protein
MVRTEGCLGRAEPEPVCGFVEGAGVGVDGDGPSADVDVVALEVGKFASSAAGPGRGDDQQSGGGAAEAAGLVGGA